MPRFQINPPSYYIITIFGQILKETLRNLVGIFIISFISSCSGGSGNLNFEKSSESFITELPSSFLFGYNVDSFIVRQGRIKANEFLSDILLKYNVPYSRIHELAINSRDIFDVRKLEKSKPYTILCAKDSAETALCFIYQPNDIDYVIYDFSKDSVSISLGQKEVILKEKEVEGIIKSSLYDALKAEDVNIMLVFEMANIFAWTIDFYRLQKNDRFKVIYEEKYVEGKAIGIEKIKAVLFVHEGKEFYAYHFEQDSVGSDYFDEAGQSLRKTFLKSPLKFSRLTSGYTQKRFHPVQKRYKAHLGTDYAAPKGTPIMSTGDGIITEAQYKSNNGNYVKIKHNSIYMTQYLHMSKIKEGIKPGVFVKQGEVIGFVGSTGLATGPHVCYRFWKHGGQVNHLREEFPPSEPVMKQNVTRYYEQIISLQERLKNSNIPS